MRHRSDRCFDLVGGVICQIIFFSKLPNIQFEMNSSRDENFFTSSQIKVVVEYENNFSAFNSISASFLWNPSTDYLTFAQKNLVLCERVLHPALLM